MLLPMRRNRTNGQLRATFLGVMKSLSSQSIGEFTKESYVVLVQTQSQKEFPSLHLLDILGRLAQFVEHFYSSCTRRQTKAKTNNFGVSIAEGIEKGPGIWPGCN